MNALETLKALEVQGSRAFEAADSVEAFERARIAYLGRQGKLKAAGKGIAEAPDKRAFGVALNACKKALEAAAAAARERLATVRPDTAGPQEDITLPGQVPRRGRLHPLTQTIRDLVAIFRSMGFALEDGPEVEDEFHNFEALNIPPGHLARDRSDNFFLRDADGVLLRPQTSTAQIRVMERQPPPIRVIVPGRTYRPDTVDATHHYTFTQVEGLVVEEGITFADLKAVLDEFLHAYFREVKFTWRLRPHFFPFTEPSAEVDVQISGSGRWLEMLGCGMVDPNVFAAINARAGRPVIDPERYTGFAFGMGVERLTMLRHGVSDLRYFLENDVRFLEQF